MISNLESLQKSRQVKLQDINFVVNPPVQVLQAILRRIPKSYYIEGDDYELDIYNEISFELTDNTFLQNSVEQEYITKTNKINFYRDGETILESIQKQNIQDKIKSIILYLYLYKSNRGKVIDKINAIAVFKLN